MAFLLGMALAPQAKADFISPVLTSFALTNTSSDGTVALSGDGLSFMLTGGQNGSGLPGSTEFTGSAQFGGIVQFQYSYASADDPGFDNAGYQVNGVFTQLADADGKSGVASFSVTAGTIYGWRVNSADNQGGPGVLTVQFNPVSNSPVPEPASLTIAALGIGITAVAAAARRRMVVRNCASGIRERNA